MVRYPLHRVYLFGNFVLGGSRPTMTFVGSERIVLDNGNNGVYLYRTSGNYREQSVTRTVCKDYANEIPIINLPWAYCTTPATEPRLPYNVSNLLNTSSKYFLVHVSLLNLWHIHSQPKVWFDLNFGTSRSKKNLKKNKLSWGCTRFSFCGTRAEKTRQ